MNTSLTLNGNFFSIQEIAEIDPEVGKTSFEKSTLAFCKQWLLGENEFTLQTSGSTGTPKKIILSRSQMEASAKLTIEALQLTPGMNALVCLDTQYIAGKMMLVRSLINKMNIISVEPEANPLRTVKDRIDFAAFVPYQVEKIIVDSKDKLDKINCAIIGGAPVTVGLQEKLPETTCRLYATYGMTETISHIALQKLNGPDASDFFTTQPGVKIQLNKRGCLTIQAAYLGSEPILTNDLVELLSPTTFKWLGRFDNVINTGGIKVSPEKVEKAFEKLFFDRGMIHRFFISSIPDSQLGNQVVLIIESSPFSEERQKLFLNNASHLLNKYETPKRILFIDKFIETATGKINRLEIQKQLKF
jgi:O-succinylbenzoic acid--CoA ligase